jgi:hypothetical protein
MLKEDGLRGINKSGRRTGKDTVIHAYTHAYI